MIECKQLCKQYGTVSGLKDLTFTVEKGTITGLFGANGSGKSTFIKLMAGIMTPTSGSITINGKPPGIASKKIISYLPERTYLNDWMKTKDIISFFADFYEDFDAKKAEEMMTRFKINPNVRLDTLSKGTKEKIQIILVMSREADLYLLDEPIGGVDSGTREVIINTIIGNYREEASVILSTHLIRDVEKILDNVILLKEGELHLHASVDEIRSQYKKSVDDVFREEFRW